METIAEKPPEPPTIDFEGGRLRPLKATDAEALYDYLRDPLVTELTSYPVVTPPMIETMIDRCRTRWAAGDLSKWGVTLGSDDRLVGICGFNDWSRPHRWTELAFDLSRVYWGRGLMRRAVATTLRWAFDQDLVDRVHAYVRVDNERSRRLLERAGFVREGCLRSYRVCRGQRYDFHLYALLRSEWAATSTDRP